MINNQKWNVGLVRMEITHDLYSPIFTGRLMVLLFQMVSSFVMDDGARLGEELVTLRLRQDKPQCGCDGGVEMSGIGAIGTGTLRKMRQQKNKKNKKV
ncbi:hypothetical protein ACOMHN_056739 [Nucella lapillus]